MARGSSPSSTRSCLPIVEMTIPSRSAHSDTVSSLIPVRSIRSSVTAMPAGQQLGPFGVDARRAGRAPSSAARR